MRYSYLTVVTLLLAIHILIPIIMIVWTWTRQYLSVMGWLLQVLAFASYFGFIFLIGTWALDLYSSLLSRFAGDACQLKPKSQMVTVVKSCFHS
jgi:hypothetical protein